jgi:protoheme IX farnesyltransferase
MVVATFVAGLGSSATHVGFGRAAAAMIGTWLLVAAANALNMWLERESDAAMERTRARPLPAGRLSPDVALRFALALVVASLGILAATSPLCAALGAIALVAYAPAYTLLKRRTKLALHVGAIAGALPPLMGRVVAVSSIDRAGLWLFALLFAWQLPHFVAIAIVRGAEYDAAGLAMGSTGAKLPRAKLSLVVWSGALLLTAPFATVLGLAGARFAVVSAIAGAGFVALAIVAALPASGVREARRVFFASMAHLCVVLVALSLDHAA